MRSHEKYGKRYDELPLADRTELLESMLSKPSPHGLQFFLTVRQNVLDEFYTSAVGQSSLNYVPPSNGYPYPSSTDIDDGVIES